jgi:hypothetical protein
MGQLCDKVRGTFKALPSIKTKDVVAGRWFIQGCSVTQPAPQTLGIHLDGPGWEWVDQTETRYLVFGFHVRQYVYFRASVDLSVAFDKVWFDDSSKTATVTIRNVVGPRVNFQPLTAVNASGANLLGSVVGDVAPGFVSARAKAAAEERGKASFEGTLKDGMTITYVTATGRTDTVMGRPAPGAVPQRPIRSPPAPATPPLVNEEEEFHAGGLHILGPFSLQTARSYVYLKAGPGIAYAVVCADGVQYAGNVLSQDGMAAPAARPVMNYVQPGQLSSVAVTPPRPCPWVLVTWAPAGRDALAVVGLFQ